MTVKELQEQLEFFQDDDEVVVMVDNEELAIVAVDRTKCNRAILHLVD
jgi:hypothetical protein